MVGGHDDVMAAVWVSTAREVENRICAGPKRQYDCEEEKTFGLSLEAGLSPV